MPFTQMHLMANNNGGSVANFWFYHYLQLMMLIEFATFDTQSALSTGFSYAVGFDYKYQRLCGRTLEFGNGSGEVIYNATPPSIENHVSYFELVNVFDDYVEWQDMIMGGSKYTATQYAVGGMIYNDLNLTNQYTTISVINSGGVDYGAPIEFSTDNRIVACSYRGIENPYGATFQRAAGIYYSNDKCYLTLNPDAYLGDYQAWESFDYAIPSSSNYISSFDYARFFALSVGYSGLLPAYYLKFSSSSTEGVTAFGGRLNFTTRNNPITNMWAIPTTATSVAENFRIQA